MDDTEMNGIYGRARNAALRLDACRLAVGLRDAASAARLMLSPQGREFMRRHGWPTLDVLRQDAAGLRVHGVVVDGAADVRNADVVAAGDADVAVRLSGTGRLWHVVALHGARVRVVARDWAVVTVDNISGEVEVDADATARVHVRMPQG